MRRTGLALAVGLFSAAVAVGAQPPRAARIGWLANTAQAGAAPGIEAFRRTLRERG